MLSALQQAQQIMTPLVDLRRELHRHAELAFEEVQTAKVLIGELDRLGIAHEYLGVGHPVVANMVVNDAGPTIAFRADMDALPGSEQTQLSFASLSTDTMHACGHDAHMAIVMGALRLLQLQPAPVNVRAIFQPAEEKGGGANVVIADGYLDGVAAIFGGHVTQHHQVGEIMVASGTITAQSDRFSIQVHGRGGHGARPHEAIDAVVIAASLVSTLQTLVSREVDPLHPSVVTVGQINAGTAPNVIAESATLLGTIRTTDPVARAHIHSGIRRIALAFQDLHRAELVVQIDSGYPPVINTPAETTIARQAAQRVVGAEGIIRQEHPSMGGEDFSFYLKRLPGCYVRFGARPEDQPFAPLHSPTFDVDERVLPIGAAFFHAVAQAYATGAK